MVCAGGGRTGVPAWTAAAQRPSMSSCAPPASFVLATAPCRRRQRSLRGRRASRVASAQAGAAMRTLYALDFDGVICDSVGESSLSGWKACVPDTAAPRTPAFLTAPCRLAPVLRPGGGAPVAGGVLHRGCQGSQGPGAGGHARRAAGGGDGVRERGAGAPPAGRHPRRRHAGQVEVRVCVRVCVCALPWEHAPWRAQPRA